MEAPSPTPLKTYLKLQEKLLEIEAVVIQFTNLPTDTPSLDHLAEEIQKKIAFFKNFLTAETASHDSTSHDLSEIEEKFDDLEAEFFQSNSRSEIVHENDDSGNSSSSVCDNCCNNNEIPVAGNQIWKVYDNPAILYEAIMSPSEMFHQSEAPSSEMFTQSEAPSSEMLRAAVVPASEMLHAAVVPPSEMNHEAEMPRSDMEDAKAVSFDCEWRQTGGGKKRERRWWWGRRRRMLVVLMTVIGVVSTLSFSVYICDQHDEGFLAPT